MTRESRGPAAEGRRALNQHLHHHHGGPKLPGGTLEERLAQHDELHWWDRTHEGVLKHTHLPYQEGETDLDMARRMLAEGTAAHQISE